MDPSICWKPEKWHQRLDITPISLSLLASSPLACVCNFLGEPSVESLCALTIQVLSRNLIERLEGFPEM